MVATEGSLDVHVTSLPALVLSVMLLNCSTVSEPEMDSDVAASFLVESASVTSSPCAMEVGPEMAPAPETEACVFSVASSSSASS